MRIVADTEAGKTVDIGIVARRRRRRRVPVEIGLLEEPTLAAAAGPGDGGRRRSQSQVVLGLSVKPVTAEEREQLGLGEDVEGLVVTAVED